MVSSNICDRRATSMYYEFRLDNAVTQRNSAGLDLPCPARLFATKMETPKLNPLLQACPLLAWKCHSFGVPSQKRVNVAMSSTSAKRILAPIKYEPRTNPESQTFETLNPSSCLALSMPAPAHGHSRSLGCVRCFFRLLSW